MYKGAAPLTLDVISQSFSQLVKGCPNASSGGSVCHDRGLAKTRTIK